MYDSETIFSEWQYPDMQFSVKNIQNVLNQKIIKWELMKLIIKLNKKYCNI